MRPFFRRGPVALCLLALSGWAASATLYKWVDAQGVVHYSDTPHAGAQVIQVQGAQTYHNTPAPNVPSATAPPPAATNSSYSCAITQPASDSSLFAPESVDVTVRASPGLQAGDQFSVTVDGQALAPIGDDGVSFRVLAPDRGAHTVAAQVRNASGTVLCTAAVINFYIQRPSVNSPTAPVGPH